MSSNLNTVVLSLLFFFLIRCENELINIQSDQIGTALEVIEFKINSENSYSFTLNPDSLDISESHRLYASSDIASSSGNSNILLLIHKVGSMEIYEIKYVP